MPYLSRSHCIRPLGISRRVLLGLVALPLALGGCTDLPLSLAGPGPEGRSAARNPLEGVRFYVDPQSPARRKVDEWRSTRPGDAALLEKIASQPQAVWVGDWHPEPYRFVRQVVSQITAAGALPVLVLYNLPHRDCGQYSAGGASGATSYARWVSEVARGIGAARAAVVLEPDGLAGMDCLSPADQRSRNEMLRKAVRTLKSSGSVIVYLDAGNAGWHPAEVIAARLQDAGVGEADGFALNVAGYRTDSESIAYGTDISARVGGKHFLVDTSRNGRGAAPGSEWCNAPGRALGRRPTTATGHPRVDAFLWIKNPGESDGECNGGPSAGQWWPEYALGLAGRASW